MGAHISRKVGMAKLFAPWRLCVRQSLDWHAARWPKAFLDHSAKLIRYGPPIEAHSIATRFDLLVLVTCLLAAYAPRNDSGA